MSDAPPEEEGAKPAKPPGPKTPKVVLLLLLINLGGTGFNAFQGMQQAQAQAQAAHAPVKGEHAAEEAKKDEPGPVLPIDPFIVNLNEKDASRYLKATFEIEVADGEVAKVLEKQKRPVRDDILRYLSSLTVSDTQGEEGKAKIQQEVVKRLDAKLGPGKVKHLFFVEFMVQ